MRSKTLIAAIFSIVMICSIGVQAQDWSKEQKEVWTIIEKYTEHGAKGDIEELSKYFHKDFSGWSTEGQIPTDYDTRLKFMKYYSDKVKVLLYDLKPLSITVFENVAVIHYVSTSIYKIGDEPEKFDQSKWTDILLKQGAKWVLIADHGGSASE
ncbi:hypothetical protein BVY01_02170 [bacterium I07]|nr:hypothetical protein BVY01_02170 [bacterium I07]